mmetsp:Transcript_13832/g.39025  ORF Transcript_13832/g.39025 Transcript_13832/m.39025 type:complete len:129 (+) Transcript_13832:929-1315(+)
MQRDRERPPLQETWVKGAPTATRAGGLEMTTATGTGTGEAGSATGTWMTSIDRPTTTTTTMMMVMRRICKREFESIYVVMDQAIADPFKWYSLVMAYNSRAVRSKRGLLIEAEVTVFRMFFPGDSHGE